MICVFVILLTMCWKSGLAHDCHGVTNCHEFSDTEWHDGIFCHSIFAKDGYFLKVNCFWLPYRFSSSNEYKQQLVWGNGIDCGCMEIDAKNTSKDLTEYDLIPNGVYKIWVLLQFSNHECVKTKKITIIPEAVCQAPLIQYASQSANLLRFQLDRIGQLRYKEMETDHWYTINITDHSVNVSLPETSKSFVVQQRCLSESCFHCRWTQEKSIPHELTGSPDVTVITEEFVPGKQRVCIEWKYAMHVYVDVYIVIIQKLPNSCNTNIAFRTNSTNICVSLSIAFFDVSVIASNEAGNSSLASALVRPLPSPELPGKIFATYEHGMILLTWSPVFSNDFCVISWGTNYIQMTGDVVMNQIQNYSIPGPFERLKCYTIMIHLYDSNMCMDSTTETAFGITYIYVGEGGIQCRLTEIRPLLSTCIPCRKSSTFWLCSRITNAIDVFLLEDKVPSIGSPNVTIKNVTKTSAVIDWEEIPEEDCLGFLLFYRIFCTDVVRNITQEITVNSSSKRSYRIEELTSSHEYHVRVSGVTSRGAGPPSANLIFTTLHYAEGEFQIIIISTCVGLMLIAVITVSVCTYILHRTKNWYFPKIPNPQHSHLSRINEEPSTKIKLVQLLQIEEEVSCGNTYVEVIEMVPVLSTPKDSCVQDMEINMYSDYQNQWCPPGQAPLTQGESTISVQQTTNHINEGSSEVTQPAAI